MAVPVQTPFVEYIANGVTTNFSLGFDCENQSHLIVTVDDIEPIVGSWSLSVGAVVFNSAPISGSKIIIKRNSPFERDRDFQLYDQSFRPPAVNLDLDRIWRKLQELGVMDWLLGNRIDDLKKYVDDRDDELRAYLLEEIRKQGVALDQLEDYYNYLMQRLAEIAVNGGWESSFVSYGSITQKKYNDGVESISELLAIQNPFNGMSLKVKSYLTGLKKGGDIFTFIANDTTSADNVTVFEVDGGRWHRLNWKNPNIFDCGLDGTETDATVKFQALVDAATDRGLSVNLCKKTIKVTQLDIPSNMHLFNGTIDVTSSNWQNTYGRAALMFKNTNRNAPGVDYEVASNYTSISETKSIKFVNVGFKAHSYAGLFYKFDGLEFISCSGNWNIHNLFKFVGGWNGTVLVSDTPTSYNLVDPINGRCKNILVKDCKWNGGYTSSEWSSPFRFVACEDVYIEGGKCDSPLGYHIDIYNKGFTLNCADYVNTNSQVVLDTIAGTAHPDMLAVYIGQNCYDININGGRWKDFAKKGIYIEASSQVTIDGVVARCTNSNSVAIFADLQPNYKDNANTYWGNVADIVIKNCTVNGVRSGIQTSQFGGVKSLRAIHIEDNLIKTNSTLAAISITGTENYTLANNNCKGSLFLGRNNGGGSVSKNRFLNDSNFALYIDRMHDGIYPSLVNNEFYVLSGKVIYDNGGTGKIGQIIGGKIQSADNSSIFQLGEASSIVCYDFDNGVTQRQQNFSQNITVNGNSTASYTKSITGVRQGWKGNLSVHAIDELGYDLTFVVTCKTNQIVFSVKNNTGSAVNFSPNLLLRLDSFADSVFVN